MAVAINRAMNVHGGSASSLRRVWRLMIDNDETRDIVSQIQSELNVRPGHTIELQSGNPFFFRLLGSDNGKGVARMLAEYPDKFGRKTIKSVRVHDIPALCWELEGRDLLPNLKKQKLMEKDSPLSNKEQRFLKKSGE